MPAATAPRHRSGHLARRQLRRVLDRCAAGGPGRQRQPTDVYLRDTTSTTSRILVIQRRGKPGNDPSFEPTISADWPHGRVHHQATNLTGRRGRQRPRPRRLGDPPPADRIKRLGRPRTGIQPPKNSFTPVISGNGRAVSFQSFGSYDTRDDDRREDVYVRNLTRGRTSQVSLLPNGRDVTGSVLNGDISDNGKRIVFGDSNNLWVRMTDTQKTHRFWHEPDSPPCQPHPMGSAGRPVISGNGLFVAFASCATALPDENGAWTDVYRLELVLRQDHPGAPGQQGRPLLPAEPLPHRPLRRLRLGGRRPGTRRRRGPARRLRRRPADRRGRPGLPGPGRNRRRQLQRLELAAISGDGRSLVYRPTPTTWSPATASTRTRSSPGAADTVESPHIRVESPHIYEMSWVCASPDA